MRVTEEQAKKMWCPMTRVINLKRDSQGDTSQYLNLPSSNRGVLEGNVWFSEGSSCIGKRCMLFRLVPRRGLDNGEDLFECGLS